MSMFNRVQRDDAWVLEMSKAEEGQSVEVGGLYRRLPGLNADASRRSLAQFVGLSRRQLGLSAEELAARAKVELAELLAIETGFIPNSETVTRVAAFLNVDAEPLLALAGLSRSVDRELGNVAVQFTARLEPITPLEPREQAALNWFKSEAFKPRVFPVIAG
jgi:transcriptional regulator with XRE-family HTH domain